MKDKNDPQSISSHGYFSETTSETNDSDDSRDSNSTSTPSRKPLHRYVSEPNRSFVNNGEAVEIDYEQNLEDRKEQLKRLRHRYQHQPSPAEEDLNISDKPSLPVSFHCNDDLEYDFMRANFGSLVQLRKNDRDRLEQLKVTSLHIYTKGDKSKEPVSLHEVAQYDEPEIPQFCFDGKLSDSNGASQLVTAIDILRVSVGYVRDFPDGQRPYTDEPFIWFQTKISARYEAWYIAESASPLYRSCFLSSMWLARFTKMVIDYLHWASYHKRSIHLSDFKDNFYKCLTKWHGKDAKFLQWHADCGNIADFRQCLSCWNHNQFVYGQAFHVKDNGSDDDAVLAHPVWNEIGLPLEQPRENQKPCSKRTSVTSHVANSFLVSFPEWGPQGWNLLEVIGIDSTVRNWREERRRYLGLSTTDFNRSSIDVDDILSQAVQNLRVTQTKPISARELIKNVVLVRVHNNSCCGRPCACKNLRYAYVHGADDLSTTDIEVSWLLVPSETACVGRYAGRDRHKKATAFYPHRNVLFWNGDSKKITVSTSDVLQSFSVSLREHTDDTQNDIIVSRAYYHQDKSFRSVDKNISGQLSAESSNDSSYASKLKSLSIFSGCGLLDNGIEIGSGHLFQTIFSADIDGHALKSARANHRHSESCQFHHEDVNVLFREFCTGQRDLLDIDCFIAGCPCQGFSKMNNWKNTLNSQKNCSLLAHTLAWIDLLLPKMVVIENVLGMDGSGKESATPSAAGQAVCHLLSLGYQVKLVTVNASDFGGATSRLRVFIIASVPGIPLPDLPQPVKAPRSSRFVTRDLNEIDNNTAINIFHPDHTPYERIEPFLKGIVALVPRNIPDQRKRMLNLSHAVPLMNDRQKRFYEECSQEQRSSSGGILRRVHPNRPFGTITAGWVLLDARGYPKIHWEQDRTLSLLELRRFHGVPDDYILIGPSASQLHQLGNSVAFATSTLIGKMLATAWRKGILRQRQRLPSIIGRTVQPTTPTKRKQPSQATNDYKPESEVDEDMIIVEVKKAKVNVPSKSTLVTPSQARRSPRYGGSNKNNSSPKAFHMLDSEPLVIIPTRQRTMVKPKDQVGSTPEKAIVIDDD